MMRVMRDPQNLRKLAADWQEQAQHLSHFSANLKKRLDRLKRPLYLGSAAQRNGFTSHNGEIAK
jgi:uncharacterized protein YukE